MELDYLKIKLTFTADKKPYLLDISSLLYDFELLHDLFLIIYADEYKYYKIANYFWYRKGRPIKREHRIKTLKIEEGSPLTVKIIVSLIFALSGAFWALIQAIERISNWNLNRKKLKLEVEKLEKERNIKFYEEQQAKIEFEKKLSEREAWGKFNELLKRLEANPLKLKDLEISHYKDTDEKNVAQ